MGHLAGSIRPGGNESVTYIVIIACILGALAALLVGIIWYFQRPKQRLGSGATTPEPGPAAATYQLCVLPPGPEFVAGFAFGKQTPAWQAAMHEVGLTLKSQGVRHILLAHGTFVGDDPVGLVNFSRIVLPGLSPRLVRRIRTSVKAYNNFLAQDLGNFPPIAIKLMERSLGIPCSDFTWSSANHHWARMVGAYDLILRLAQITTDFAPSDRIVLVGHSHAGQLFALVAALICPEATPIKEPLLAFFERHFGSLAGVLAGIDYRRLVFVTLGTPRRYPWPQMMRNQVVHIVNHRGDSLATGSVRRALQTFSGDYVQRYAVSGSDFRAVNKTERLGNAELDQILGPGEHLPTWRRLARNPERPLNWGHSLLVDFGDQSRLGPNFVATILGHGTYTKGKHMLPLWQLLAGHMTTGGGAEGHEVFAWPNC